MTPRAGTMRTANEVVSDMQLPRHAHARHEADRCPLCAHAQILCRPMTTQAFLGIKQVVTPNNIDA